ncbi:hypothetical protein BP5796_10410 [Coleophoma crateriformis]|uniref:Uncharacterized protein n=1 Tax=Coleophoma crateriformis TaxID=565419 RepID=A0A3D8QQF5_9HELO|nr:hypothetical protein BP5796_10410 [Coleophoma crateriformis]
MSGLLGGVTNALDQTLTGGKEKDNQGGLLGSVGGLVGGTLSGVGNAVGQTTQGLGNAVGQTTQGLGSAVGQTTQGLGGVTGGLTGQQQQKNLQEDQPFRKQS